MSAWALPFSADNPLMKNLLFKSGALILSLFFGSRMKFYLCNSFHVYVFIVLSILLMISIQDLFSFGMVLFLKHT